MNTSQKQLSREKENMRILGIDPGLRKQTVGFAVLEAPCGLTAEKAEHVTDFFEYLCLGRVITGGVLSGPGTKKDPLGSARQVAETLWKIANRYRVDYVCIEDFLYRGESPKRAPASVASKMRLFVGFLHGFFTARGFRVHLILPRTWKARIRRISKETPEEWLATRFPEVPSVLETPVANGQLRHVFSAVGVALAL